MLWLSRAGLGESYVASIALPMVLVGAGQGLAFAPLTNAGIAGVATEDAGAASGLVNTAHQLGFALGLGILVAVAAHARADLTGGTAVAARFHLALSGSSVLLALALVVAAVVILPGRHARPARAGRAVERNA
jgi:sugar phosphate permease